MPEVQWQMHKAQTDAAPSHNILNTSNTASCNKQHSDSLNINKTEHS